MSTSLLVLIHSPLVGPLAWKRCSDVLRARGHRVAVPSLAGAFDAPPPYYQVLAERVAGDVRAAHPEGSVVLVAHSGAGSLLPSIADVLEVPVDGAIFADAILPHPGARWFDTAPAALCEQLRGMARDGRLPPWDRWFPPDALAALLPEAELRARFVAELHELPLAYFEERAPGTVGWPSVRCGYLRLSAPYEEAATEAERRGWPTVRTQADHLAILTCPGEIATAIERLTDAATIRHEE